MISAVLFDLDGVLVSTDEYHYLSWKRLCDEEGFTFFDHKFNDQFRGVARMECVEILLSAAGKKCSADEKQEIADRKNRYFVESLATVADDALLPGSFDALKELKKRNIKIAIASNSRNAKMIIKQVHIEQFIDAIIDGHEIENSKPHPEVFLLAAESVGAAPAECLVVEDAVTGIEAARRAGMKSLGIGTKERLPNASIVVPNLEAISIDKLLSL